ncbi:MAG: Spermidine/putrescine import ATP-binding protein PotA [Anaerolineae bacterium]|nr:Spermidine/putrescine import ATP-binding protein PotA [Anaerolineae bacterium]
MTQVELRHLNKIYAPGGAHAVKDLSLTVPGGQITALLGPSGCGKTTALKLIAGLIAPTGGDILFDGQSVGGVPAEKRQAVLAFQNHLLFPHMSVAENVGFGLKMRGVDQNSMRRQVAELLELVRLPGLENRRPAQLSGGQQQRVALARALIVKPRVLLLDEPLSNLDAHLRGEMRDLIIDIQRRLKLTTIFVTHDQEEAVLLAQQIALIFEGQLQQFGPPPAFYERPRSRRVAQFFGAVNFIPGVKKGRRVTTALGVLECAANGADDGPVTLTIRPENVGWGNGSDHNLIRGQVAASVYLGTHARFKVDAPPHALEVITAAAQASRIHPGQSVALHLPPDKLWLLPGAE